MSLHVSRRPPWLYVVLKQIENIRCFNSAVARLRNSGQTGPRLHAHIMFMWTVRAKLIGSTRRSKAMNSGDGMSQTCGVSANCNKPVARRRVRRSEAAKWSPVRDALVYCWPNNGPRLAGRIQHSCHVCGDRQSQTAKAGLCGSNSLSAG